jgi:hypothetical protein
MRHCGRSLAVALACLAISVLLGRPAAADDVTMGGTFTMGLVEGTVGEDLLPIVGTENGWTIALWDVESRCTEEVCPSNPSETIMIITLHAGSFEFEFSGPDAALLNNVVADQLTQGGHAVDGYFEVTAADCSGPLSFAFWFSVWPDVPCEGVYWSVQGFGTQDTFPRTVPTARSSLPSTSTPTGRSSSIIAVRTTGTSLRITPGQSGWSRTQTSRPRRGAS